MGFPERLRQLRSWAEHQVSQPDLARATRATVAVMVPLLLARAGLLPVEPAFAVIAAQSMCLVDVRGAYSFRFGLLLAMALVLAGSAELGSLAAGNLGTAVTATALLAISAGLWRHLSAEYGPSLATPAALVFFMALSIPQHGSHGLSVLAGALWGLALQIALWPVHAEHPLRRAVAESWLAAGDLFEELSPFPGAGATDAQRTAKRESQLRTTLDSTYGILETASTAHRSRRPFLTRLEEVHVDAARLATQVLAMNAALEAIASRPVAAVLNASLQVVLESLANVARSVALAVVSRDPAGLTRCELRIRRSTNLLRSLAVRAGADADAAPLLDVLRNLETRLSDTGIAVAAVTDRAAERAEFSLELFDLRAGMLRPLAASLNLHPRFEPAIVRYAARIGGLTMLGVLVSKLSSLPHGYWLPFTMVVVLQPDYGATRQKALQRVLGTIAGGVLGSGLLLLHVPIGLLLAATALTAFMFAYFLRRNYGVAVVFITLFVVLLTEASGPATLALAAERLLITTAGGVTALVAALIFWPSWERDRLPRILSAALLANRQYLLALCACLARGGGITPELVQAKRNIETANNEAFASVQRLFADPASRREGTEQAAVLANGNQRLTRALNVIFAHQTAASPPVPLPALPHFIDRSATALEGLAEQVNNALQPPTSVGSAVPVVTADQVKLPLQELPKGNDEASIHARRVFGQLARAAAELRGMLLAPPPSTWAAAAAENSVAQATEREIATGPCAQGTSR
jgi:uncharacterized membrane protein YccC